MHVDHNTQAWINVTFNMAPYAGTTVGIKFLAHGDNAGDPTDMFVDDVTLFVPCVPSPTATATSSGPTNTATPTLTITPTATPTCPFPLNYNIAVSSGATVV